MSPRWIRAIGAVVLPAALCVWAVGHWAAAQGADAAAAEEPQPTPAPAKSLQRIPDAAAAREAADLQLRVRSLEMQLGEAQERLVRMQNRIDWLEQENARRAKEIQERAHAVPSPTEPGRRLEPGPVPKSSGWLIVDNRTPVGRYIWVNLDRYYLGPYERRSIEVPEGTVHYRLDEENWKVLTVGAGAAREVTIVPRAW